MKLYSYFRSSAAYRARIALNLKGIAYETVSIHLIKEGGLNRRPEFRAINPQMRVPVLVTDAGKVLIQSLAIIEYLDETHPEPALLPKDPLARAHVRALAELIACDIHPLNNTSTLRYLKHAAASGAKRDRRLVPPLGDRGFRGPRSAADAWALCLRRQGHDRRRLPGPPGRQCAPSESAARQISQDRQRRCGLSRA